MATQIKVANEAKQDITINKADQILGRLADQTIIAKTVKSIQRGVTVLSKISTSITIHPINPEKSVVSILNYKAPGAGGKFSGYVNSLSSDCINFAVLSESSITEEAISWQVTEFY